MPLNANALTDLASTKSYLDIDTTDTSKDSIIEFLINAASEAIEKYCRRKMKQATYTDEEYDGTGSQNLYLKQYPISSITSIKIDDVVVAATEYKTRKESGIVVRMNAMWDKGILNLKVTYQAGYAAIPSDVELACKHLVKFYFKTEIADFSTTFGEGFVMRPEDWPRQVKALLSPHRKVLI
ncbi:head-tail connector protein [Effusibacillus consociatus]|uniref:Head-tail connector protein n=1 Tax=Effusibacillus consociatus TaxID=1117041 RepID=A0ABV9Q496_9BACL